MRSFFALMVIGFLTTLAVAAAKPNVIVIFSDDHGWADLGSNGRRQ
ncbi:hypothetical protein BH11PLA2_BH11PLA2_52580 [soil metagenome]